MKDVAWIDFKPTNIARAAGTWHNAEARLIFALEAKGYTAGQKIQIKGQGQIHERSRHRR